MNEIIDSEVIDSEIIDTDEKLKAKSTKSLENLLEITDSFTKLVSLVIQNKIDTFDPKTLAKIYEVSSNISLDLHKTLHNQNQSNLNSNDNPTTINQFNNLNPELINQIQNSQKGFTGLLFTDSSKDTE